MHYAAILRIVGKQVGDYLAESVGEQALSIFLMALCTSSFEAETPRCAYLSAIGSVKFD